MLVCELRLHVLQARLAAFVELGFRCSDPVNSTGFLGYGKALFIGVVPDVHLCVVHWEMQAY